MTTRIHGSYIINLHLEAGGIQMTVSYILRYDMWKKKKGRKMEDAECFTVQQAGRAIPFSLILYESFQSYFLFEVQSYYMIAIKNICPVNIFQLKRHALQKKLNLT